MWIHTLQSSIIYSAHPTMQWSPQVLFYNQNCFTYLQLLFSHISHIYLLCCYLQISESFIIIIHCNSAVPLKSTEVLRRICSCAKWPCVMLLSLLVSTFYMSSFFLLVRLLPCTWQDALSGSTMYWKKEKTKPNI